MVVIKKEEKLVETLTRFVTEHRIQGGYVSGIGALKDVELGYYELEKQTYLRKTFQDDDYELLCVKGNITLRENTPYIHVHALLGARDFSTFGGHLFEATVAVTAEITIIPFGVMPHRALDKETGLHLICGFKE